MPNKHHLLLVGLGGALVGFILANAPSNTGIYATPIGQSLANVYMALNDKASA